MAFLEVATFKKPLFKVAIGLCAFPLAFASGCAMTSAIKESDLVEAYASNLNLTQKQQIESKISSWFGGVKVTLADDVFTESSQVSIERKAHMDERRLPVEGRHNNPAFTFTLLTDGKNCVLRNNQTGETETLSGVTCRLK
ncbi:hypothetical protein [uncultured Alteromonas sp.]|jgi:hypothetical protein|uniref:hypothetical protein n=1 Tax=uncultured Alteromonas sp. TaxID=179113 RepID=UPI002584C9C5|nr:hypothetical protein [uncultured Alteromonas sp.]|tara:strand:- start:2216 stop:2638 length:423 start_codon:yes stop_codon:yes gene_type:complete